MHARPAFPGRLAWAPITACLLALAAPARAEPDEDALGKAQGYPVGTLQNWVTPAYRVGSWSALDQVPGIRVARVAPAASARPLPPFGDAPAIRYRYRNLGYTVDEYLERQRATGLLILKDGKVVLERYRYGRGPQSHFLSFSMAKSVTSLLVGVALEKGLIQSLDDPAEKYARDLAGTAYGGTSLRNLLRMSSGVAFSERYDGKDDIARMSEAFARAPGGAMEVLRTFQERQQPAGSRFAYSSAETQVMGYVLRGATGKSVAELTQAWLWEPMGAEQDGFWRIGADGQEGTFAYLNATLRDWGRLGALLAADGKVGDRQVVPRDYLLAATDVRQQPAPLQPGTATPFFGYGYSFWLLPWKERTFMMQGVYGQSLYVQPASGIVLVITSVWKDATARQDPEPWRESNALWAGVVSALGGRAD